MVRVIVDLQREDYARLVKAAVSQERGPNGQATWLLRRALARARADRQQPAGDVAASQERRP